jgi:hypothetical protein
MPHQSASPYLRWGYRKSEHDWIPPRRHHCREPQTNSLGQACLQGSLPWRSRWTGLTAGAPVVIAMWVLLVALGHPLIAMGAAICERTLRRVAVSLPIGYLLDDARDTPGILASQSIDFPPKLLATLLGFVPARIAIDDCPYRQIAKNLPKKKRYASSCRYLLSRLSRLVQWSARRGYFTVIRRLDVRVLVGAIGEIENVSHVFQPAGRFSAANSPYPLRFR